MPGDRVRVRLSPRIVRLGCILAVGAEQAVVQLGDGLIVTLAVERVVVLVGEAVLP